MHAQEHCTFWNCGLFCVANSATCATFFPPKHCRSEDGEGEGEEEEEEKGEGEGESESESESESEEEGEGRFVARIL